MSAGRHLAGAHGAQIAQIAPGAPDTSGTSSTPGGPGGPERGDRLEAAASVLALLADRTRLALMERLGRGEADVTTLTEACGAARPSVSQHLAKLRLAGLVTTRKDGRRVVYALGHGHLRRLVDEALNVADHQLGSLPPHD
ncbi:metalloregulator ArsR/SmtB family transcription factor [Streptomyces sp. NBC_01214]|uniref:ArsR/SmtB family transcription factor n=1 Tax=Streptomyces sp. NBC_01214 TaxID=2903777 RepID=UPI002B1E84BD|nr:metalloregulator ArsR/SmtB family transcription factor [Streptomyces sp. NBC_01214]